MVDKSLLVIRRNPKSLVEFLALLRSMQTDQQVRAQAIQVLISTRQDEDISERQRIYRTYLYQHCLTGLAPRKRRRRARA